MNCVICETRKPRRYCPGVSGEICSICCGTEREETVDCPLDCEYLRAAHLHADGPPIDTSAIPDRDIEVTEEFLEQREWLLVLLGSALLEKAPVPPCTDFDVREALASLIKTYRTLQSGLVYESLPTNPYAAAMHEAIQNRVAELKDRIAESGGTETLRDAEILGILVFLQRLEYMHNDGRTRSRAFLDFLSRFYARPEIADAESELEPDEPRIIL